MNGEKQCPACGAVKPRDAFGTRSCGRYLRSRCIECERAKRRDWYAKNAAREQEKARETYVRDREAILARLAHKRATDDSVREKERERYWRDVDAARERGRAKYARHRDHYNAYQRQRRAQSGETARARSRAYYAENRAKYLARAQVSKLARPSTCSRCSAVGPVEGHHEDYARPLDVEWLCKACHEAHHHGTGQG